jgi:predicted nucleic acid-binding protein
LKPVVLDASVAVKWLAPLDREPFTEESLSLLRRHVIGEIEFIVPDVFWAEVVNVLWKGVRQRRWTRSLAEDFSARMIAREFQTISSLTLIEAASKIAFAHDRSVYDCLYVALAIRARTEFVTADERLVNAVGAHLPVKWLGRY